MNIIIRLIKYHIVLFIVFSFFVITAFYISDGGDFNTALPIVLFYLISALLLYIPLILILTLFNFVILAIGLSTFKGLRNQLIVCFLPIILFLLWYVYSRNSSTNSYLLLSDFQLYILIGIWCFLIGIGITIYTGMRKHTLAAFLPVLIFAVWFFLQKYNFTSRQLFLSNFNFCTILLIWTALNYCLLYRFTQKNKSLQAQVLLRSEKED